MERVTKNRELLLFLSLIFSVAPPPRVIFNPRATLHPRPTWPTYLLTNYSAESLSLFRQSERAQTFFFKKMYIIFFFFFFWIVRLGFPLGYRHPNNNETSALKYVGDESTDHNNNITMTSEDLLKPGHVVKERWKVVSVTS